MNTTKGTLNKGDILTVTDVSEDESGTLVHTEAGLLGILKARGVKIGQKIQVGPVCGEWCRLFLMGDTYQARLLQRSIKSTCSGSTTRT